MRTNKMHTFFINDLIQLYCIRQVSNIQVFILRKTCTCKFYCFTVHFNSLNLIYQLMHLYIYIQEYQSKMLTLKLLKTLQHVPIIIQIIIREFVGSLLKSLDLKFYCQLSPTYLTTRNVTHLHQMLCCRITTFSS